MVASSLPDASDGGFVTGDAFAASVVAAVLGMAAYLLLTRGVDLNVLPLAARVVLKAGFVAAVFFAVMLALQPRRLMERSGYVWRLLRAEG